MLRAHRVQPEGTKVSVSFRCAQGILTRVLIFVLTFEMFLIFETKVSTF